MTLTIAVRQEVAWNGAGTHLSKARIKPGTSGAVEIPKKALADLSDEELMAACRRDDGAALEEIYKRYHRRMYAFVFRNFKRKEQVEDIVQEIFFRVYRERKRYKSSGRFSVWLYRIALNLCIDETRRYWNRYVSRETELGSGSDLPEFLETVSNKQEGVRDLMDDDRKSRILEQALMQLTDQQREILILNKFEGLTYREIGEITEQSADAIKQHAYRAFLKLRNLLEPCREELMGSFPAI